MKTFLLSFFCIAFLISGCHRNHKRATTSVTSPNPVGNATISASPNPVVGGPAQGTTTITWDAHNPAATDAEVYVLQEGQAEQLFSKGPKGSAPAPWIQAGQTYNFTLYDGSHKELATVRVTHSK
ncbi:MAG TPA: hypothetical protein VII74_04965 [Chthoniobacterales bacterium]